MQIENMIIKKAEKFDIISPFQDDPFVGHLSTPITTSTLIKEYLQLLPAYKLGLSPILRGINIGFVHGYFLLGPFVKLGPLRDSQVANFIAFLSTISLIIILTTGWGQFTSGFMVGGFGGTSIAYVLWKIINF
jgi:photosystem I subunit 11